MNILFITCWFPIPRNPNFGIFVKEHARAVQKAGANVRVAHVWSEYSRSLYQPKLKKEEDESGLIIHSLVIHSRFYKFFRFFWFLMYFPLYLQIIKKILPEFTPDCLHGNVIYPAGFITHALAKKLNIPYILTEHWSKIENFLSESFSRNKAKKIIRRASGVHPVSEFLAKKINRHINQSEKVKVVPNVVTDKFDYKPIKRDDDNLVFLCIMNHKSSESAVKKPALLIKAIAKLPPDFQEKLVLKYIGPNQEQSPAKKLLESHEIKADVKFKGIKPKSYVAREMNKADYLVHPSEYETFGVVVAEALKSGLPCVVSDLPALREHLNKDNGILVSENTPEKWAKVLKKIIMKPTVFDHEKIAETVGDKYSYETVGEKYIKSYKQALE